MKIQNSIIITVEGDKIPRERAAQKIEIFLSRGVNNSNENGTH